MRDKKAHREELLLQLKQIKKEFITKKFRWLCMFFFIVGLFLSIFSLIDGSWLVKFPVGPLKGKVLLYIILGSTVIWLILFAVSWGLSRQEEKKPEKPDDGA